MPRCAHGRSTRPFNPRQLNTPAAATGALLLALVSVSAAAPPAHAAAESQTLEMRVYYSVGEKEAKGKPKAEPWVLEAAGMQFIEGKTAGPVHSLTPNTDWVTLTKPTTCVMDCPTHGRLDVKVMPMHSSGKREVLASIKTGRARTALYVRVAPEPGARKVSRIVSGFDRPDVYVVLRVKE